MDRSSFTTLNSSIAIVDFLRKHPSETIHDHDEKKRGKWTPLLKTSRSHDFSPRSTMNYDFKKKKKIDDAQPYIHLLHLLPKPLAANKLSRNSVYHIKSFLNRKFNDHSFFSFIYLFFFSFFSFEGNIITTLFSTYTNKYNYPDSSNNDTLNEKMITVFEGGK